MTLRSVFVNDRFEVSLCRGPMTEKGPVLATVVKIAQPPEFG